jgi:hypothetical protein
MTLDTQHDQTANRAEHQRWRQGPVEPIDANTNILRAMQISAVGLRAKKILLIFPEGGLPLNPGLQTFKLGAAVLARGLRVPVARVAIRGLNSGHTGSNCRTILRWCGYDTRREPAGHIAGTVQPDGYRRVDGRSVKPAFDGGRDFSTALLSYRCCRPGCEQWLIAACILHIHEGDCRGTGHGGAQ